MTEKVISEVRVIETEDGYRIEIRGDKERMRKFGFPFRHWAKHGPRSGFWRRGGWDTAAWGPWWSDEPGPEQSSGGGPQDKI